MVYCKISRYLRVLALRVILSFDPPNVVVDVLQEFKKLFEDDSNFVSFKEWGKTSGGDRITPFTLSPAGIKKIQDLMTTSNTFKYIYHTGIAGMEGYKPCLLYFLTQYLSRIGMAFDFIDLKDEADPALGGLKKKLKKIKAIPEKLKAKQLYQAIPYKEYTQEEAQRAKKRVIDFIDDIKSDYASVEKLTEEEEKFFHG